MQLNCDCSERKKERVRESCGLLVFLSLALLSHTPSTFPWRPHWCANLEITLKCSLQWVWVWLWFNLSFRTCAKRLWLPWSGRRSGYSPPTNCLLLEEVSNVGPTSWPTSVPSSLPSSGSSSCPSSLPSSVPSSCYPAQLAGSVLWSSLMDPSS